MSTTSDPPLADEATTAPTVAESGPYDDGADIFPLPLVPFERYMVADDRPGYPMTFFIRIEVEGTPDRAAMDAAFAEALGRHSLLTARLTRRGLQRFWVPGDGPPPTLRWDFSADEPALPVGEWIDLKQSVGIRGYVHQSAGRARVVVTFHHAVCDGIGGLRFMGDLLACYGRRTAAPGQMPTLLPITQANLPYRGQFDITTPVPVPYWTVVKSTLFESWRVISRRPQVLMNANRPKAADRQLPPLMPLEELDAETYRRLIARATELGVTANDILLRDMFLCARDWNETRGGRKSRGWLRIIMPTSLRGKRDARMPATNTLGYALVTRHTDDCRDPGQLLTDIATDTEAIRTWSMGALFVEAIRVAGKVPGLIWLGARLGRRFSTLVLSNLGDPSRRFRARFPRVDGEVQAGNLIVKSIYGAPPVRPGTRAALALLSYADKLLIALHADRRWFSADDAREFLTMYRRRLEESAGL
jgi:hypothetical protein